MRTISHGRPANRDRSCASTSYNFRGRRASGGPCLTSAMDSSPRAGGPGTAVLGQGLWSEFEACRYSADPRLGRVPDKLIVVVVTRREEYHDTLTLYCQIVFKVSRQCRSLYDRPVRTSKPLFSSSSHPLITVALHSTWTWTRCPDSELRQHAHRTVPLPVLELLMRLQPEHPDECVCASLERCVRDLAFNGPCQTGDDHHPFFYEEQVVGIAGR